MCFPFFLIDIYYVFLLEHVIQHSQKNLLVDWQNFTKSLTKSFFPPITSEDYFSQNKFYKHQLDVPCPSSNPKQIYIMIKSCDFLH